MDNIVRPHFRQNQLHDLAAQIIDLIHAEAEERSFSVPEVIGTLELCKAHIITQAVEDEMNEDA